MPLWVYISGPYSHGDVQGNVMRASMAWHAVMDLGHHVYVPHLSHFLHMIRPRHYGEWMRMDLAMVEKCDVVWRIPGFSPGGDQEVAHAQSLGIPVLFGAEALSMLGRASS